MSKLINLSLDELYARKVTSTTEKVIMGKEDFSKQAPNWCSKVCKLKCKNPPSNNQICPTDNVDVLIIQDYKSLDDFKFGKSGDKIESKIQGIIQFIVSSSLDKNMTFAVTNLLKCKVTKDDIKKGKGPSDLIIAKCKPYLFEEIRRRKPKVIISLNTSVTKALGLKKSNYTNCGEIVALPEDIGAGEIPVVITLHPRILTMLRQNSSGVYWGPDFLPVIIQDFVKVKKLITKELRIPNLKAALEKAKLQIIVPANDQEVEELANLVLEMGVKHERVLSFDTETTTLDPYDKKAKILLAQFGYRKPDTGLIEVVVFPLWHRENKTTNPDKTWEKLIPILTNPDVQKVSQNGKFDIKYVYVTKGIRVAGMVFDTQLLLHCLNSGIQGMYGLKRACTNWLPELELSGYEDSLPALSKPKKKPEEMDEETEVEEE